MEIEKEIEVEKKQRILIVDDNEINRILLKKMLSNYPFELQFCDNGKSAYECVLTKQFDIVLMDIYMPIMNGLEATKEIRRLNDTYFKDLPIIALTASIISSDIEKMKTDGFNDYQSKPFKIEELVAKINKFTSAKSV